MLDRNRQRWCRPFGNVCGSPRLSGSPSPVNLAACRALTGFDKLTHWPRRLHRGGPYGCPRFLTNTIDSQQRLSNLQFGCTAVSTASASTGTAPIIGHLCDSSPARLCQPNHFSFELFSKCLSFAFAHRVLLLRLRYQKSLHFFRASPRVC